jgi:hypothetical protein
MAVDVVKELEERIAAAAGKVADFTKEMERYKALLSFVKSAPNGDHQSMIAGLIEIVGAPGRPQPPAPADAPAPIKAVRKKQDEPGSKAWNEGYQARKDRKPRSDIPHPAESVAARGWHMGWKKADEEMSVPVVGPTESVIYGGPSGGDMASASQPMTMATAAKLLTPQAPAPSGDLDDEIPAVLRR